MQSLQMILALQCRANRLVKNCPAREGVGCNNADAASTEERGLLMRSSWLRQEPRQAHISVLGIIGKRLIISLNILTKPEGIPAPVAA